MVSTSTTTTAAVSSSTVRIPTLTRTGCTGDDAAYFPSARITIDSNRCESTFLVCKVFISSFFCVFLTDLILNSLLPPEPPASDLINARCVCMHFVMCYGDKNGDYNCLLLFIHFYLFFYRYFLCSGCGGRQVKMGTVSNQYCSSCGSYINEQAPSVRSLIGLG